MWKAKTKVKLNSGQSKSWTQVAHNEPITSLSLILQLAVQIKARVNVHDVKT